MSTSDLILQANTSRLVLGLPLPASETAWIEDIFTPTAGQISFTITKPPKDLVSMEFLVNGINYEPTIDFSVSGATVTWLNVSFVLQTTDLVQIRYK